MLFGPGGNHEVAKYGGSIEPTSERLAAIARFEAACMKAIGEQKVRFTIPETDQLLVNA
jgi:hypothetical protein